MGWTNQWSLLELNGLMETEEVLSAIKYQYGKPIYIDRPPP